MVAAVSHPFDSAGAVRLYPGVSVVIPVYNRPESLTLSLAALADQSLARDDFEVLVVDDGSRGPDHLAIVQSFETRLDLRYIYQSDLGFRAAAARNQGIALARRTAIMLLDAGVILPQNVLAAVWEAHRADPDVALIGTVHGLQPAPDNDPQLEPIRVSRHPGALVTDALMVQYPDPRHAIYAAFDSDLSQFIAPWNHYWTALTTAPTRALRAIGGFDETYTSWGIEDLECGYRLMAWGVHFRWNPAVRGLHFPHDVSYPRDNGPNWQKFYARHPAVAIEVKLTVPSVRLEQALRSLPGYGGKPPRPPSPIVAEWIAQVTTSARSWVLFAETETEWADPTPETGRVFSMVDADQAPPHTLPGLGTRTSWPDGSVAVSVIGTWWSQLDIGLQRTLLLEAFRLSRNAVYLICPMDPALLSRFLADWQFTAELDDDGQGVFRLSKKPSVSKSARA